MKATPAAPRPPRHIKKSHTNSLHSTYLTDYFDKKIEEKLEHGARCAHCAGCAGPGPQLHCAMLADYLTLHHNSPAVAGQKAGELDMAMLRRKLDTAIVAHALAQAAVDEMEAKVLSEMELWNPDEIETLEMEREKLREADERMNEAEEQMKQAVARIDEATLQMAGSDDDLLKDKSIILSHENLGAIFRGVVHEPPSPARRTLLRGITLMQISTCCPTRTILLPLPLGLLRAPLACRILLPPLPLSLLTS